MHTVVSSACPIADSIAFTSPAIDLLRTEVRAPAGMRASMERGLQPAALR
jgi:hypothetical protein